MGFKMPSKINVKCIVCEYEGGIAEVERHGKATGHRPFGCNLCEDSFSQKIVLTSHVFNIHEDTWKHQCDVCPKKFKLKGNLTTHVNCFHKKLRPFHCNMCKHVAGRKSDLDRHIKYAHSNTRDHHCNNCPAKFKTKNHLTRHSKTCTGTEYISAGEFNVRDTLLQMMIDFIHDSSHVPLTEFCSIALRFDFLILISGYRPLVIEFNGQQHYTPVTWGKISQERAQDKFEIQQNHDQLKRDFCKEYNYDLLEIHYKDLNNIWDIVYDYMVENRGWRMSRCL
jgi:hypothetical protein